MHKHTHTHNTLSLQLPLNVVIVTLKRSRSKHTHAFSCRYCYCCVYALRVVKCLEFNDFNQKRNRSKRKAIQMIITMADNVNTNLSHFVVAYTRARFMSIPKDRTVEQTISIFQHYEPEHKYIYHRKDSKLIL